MFCEDCNTGQVISSVMTSNDHHCHDQPGMMIGWNKSLNQPVVNYVRVSLRTRKGIVVKDQAAEPDD